MAKVVRSLSLQDQIMKQLSCTVFVKPSRLWLDTKSPSFNAVWGSRKLGLPAGKLYQIAGKKHAAKTALADWLAGIAQRDHNAFVIKIDAENSSEDVSKSKDKKELKDKNWSQRLGLDMSPDNFYLIYPKILKRSVIRKKGKKKMAANVAFLQSCEFLFEEAEKVMMAVKEVDQDRPIVCIIDSIAFLQTESQIAAGETNNNMRTNLDRAQFLGSALPRWVSLAKNYTMWVLAINQIRVNPSVMFGNPEYSPGGSALEHACHIMGGMRRKGGTEDEDGKAARIKGYMVNAKNKAGGGSVEGEMCNYTLDFNKPYNKMWKFSPHEKKEKKVA